MIPNMQTRINHVYFEPQQQGYIPRQYIKENYTNPHEDSTPKPNAILLSKDG